MPLYLFVLLPIITSLIGYLLSSLWKKNSSHSAVFEISNKLTILLLQLFYLGLAIVNLVDVRLNGTILEPLGNYPIGIGITLRSDVFSATMVLLTVFLFTSLILFNYRKPYMNSLFFFLFLTLEGLLCGIFLSNDLFNLYVLLEVSTIVVSILIIFKKDSEAIYDGMIYFLTNLASMTLFLLGIGYLYKIFGTLDIDLIGQRLSLVSDARTLIIPYVLLITATSLKSAVMPLFSWLPKAHGVPSAPSIISAMLSGLYIKSGVYLFIRLTALFRPTFSDMTIFLVLGFMTAVIGFIFALSQIDIKLILAYSTVSQIGLILFGLSIGNEYSYYGSMYHITNHAIFKSLLFITAGMIIDYYGTRDITKIRNVFKTMPCVSIASIMAILGITGAPMFNGFISKYLIQKGGGNSLLFELCFFVINLGTIMIFVKYSSIFLTDTSFDIKPRFIIKLNQKIIILLLGALCLFGGIFSPLILNALFSVNQPISSSSFLIKLLSYLISLAIGILFYKYIYSRIHLFKKIRAIELSYNQIVMSMVAFYSVFLIYMIVRY